MQRVLVTGANGFIGKKLIQALLANDIHVTGVSRHIPQKNINNCQYISIDIRSYKDFNKLPNYFDAIFHTAAYVPNVHDEIKEIDLFDTNVFGTMNLLKFAIKHNIKHFIHSSSMSVVGFVSKGKIDETYPTNPSTLYGLSKKLSEDIVEFYARTTKLSYAILRYSSVFGEGMKPGTVLPLFIQQALQNKDICIEGPGTRSQDFVYVDDVVQANILAWKKSANGTFLIGSGHETTLLELANTILFEIPNSTSQIQRKLTNQKDEQRVCCDITKARKKFLYSPQYSLKEGIKTILK